MIIRTALASDANVLKPLLAQLGYESLSVDEIRNKIERYSQNDYAMFVSVSGSVITGFISVHIFEIFHSPGLAGRITAFCVDEKYRSRGVGMALLNHAEEFFIKSGCKRIEVTSNNRRIETHEFYLRRGYKDDSRKFVRDLS